MHVYKYVYKKVICSYCTFFGYLKYATFIKSIRFRTMYFHALKFFCIFIKLEYDSQEYGFLHKCWKSRRGMQKFTLGQVSSISHRKNQHTVYIFTFAHVICTLQNTFSIYIGVITDIVQFYVSYKKIYTRISNTLAFIHTIMCISSK